MNKAYCVVSKAPIRANPSDQAEMVTEILFGESAEVLDKQEKWWQIACSWDGYQGWIDPKQLIIFEVDKGGIGEKHCRSSALWEVPTNQGLYNIPIGGEYFVQMDGSAELAHIQLDLKIENQLVKKTKIDILDIALQYLNTPYLWGGRSNFGIDCSGFTQVCFKICQIQLPRDAYQQAEVGEEIAFSEITTSDLAFFKNSDDRIIHVGIVLPEGRIIHAHGKVRIDRLDERGIYNADLVRYTHELSGIRRVG